MLTITAIVLFTAARAVNYTIDGKRGRERERERERERSISIAYGIVH